jgi:hypothetical protein
LPLVPFPFASPMQVLTFHVRARMRITPPAADFVAKLF